MQSIINNKTTDPTITPLNANLRDLAKISGFSISTVSKALNDSSEISELTKEKLRKLANTHNYTPNKAACALRKQKSDTILICLPKHGLLTYHAIVEGILEESQAKGFQILVHQFEHDTLPQTLKKLECKKGFDGLVFLCPKADVATEKLLEHHSKKGLHLVKCIGTCLSAENEKEQRKLGRKICKNLMKVIDWKINVPLQYSNI
ncbi:LacI family DNA-binding transcriptional regulator [Flagellimonas myxillae]|uniref:LacI family DNA-binding transcriptional regulator n=1 Tax=Flagellimonas myxillae TaxID=2942214 RepID=UPI00201E7B56|nr:LacI family DNA-binding transcriptional regulator [Muricauda myxillae]MCL6265452.1 LacI family transcriptional regulator [Muricauda myxillae]